MISERFLKHCCTSAKPSNWTEGEALMLLTTRTSPGVPPQYVRRREGFLGIDQDVSPKAFAADAEIGRSPRYAVGQKHLSINRSSQNQTTSLENHLQSWYMVAKEDQMIPQQAEEIMAKRNGCHDPQKSSRHAAGLSP